MQHNIDSLIDQVVLITGAAHRVGASMVKMLHACGANIVLHYRHSRQPAEQLAAELNGCRANSVKLLQADLHHTAALPDLVAQAQACWGRLDVLINNASSYYETPVGQVTEVHWEDLLGSNLKAPFFLAQAAAPYLQKSNGCIVNIVDIHADRPLKAYSVYCIAKAGLVMLTKALAKELAPYSVRVNAVAPGAILWPESIGEQEKEQIIARTALKRTGEPKDIAKAVLYLVRDATYTTGQVLAVDGGRTLTS